VVLAVTALVHALMAVTRHRRRDLAILKTIGFTRRQLSRTVAWQSTVIVLVAIAVGVPLVWPSDDGCGDSCPRSWGSFPTHSCHPSGSQWSCLGLWSSPTSLPRYRDGVPPELQRRRCYDMNSQGAHSLPGSASNRSSSSRV
jgi:hypothetical protein